MKDLTSRDIAKYRVRHPAGDVPTELLPYCGAFVIPVVQPSGLKAKLRVIASRAEGVEEMDDWDHVSVSLHNRCPKWEEMCLIKELFFEPDEVAMQLHPVKDYVNNHPYCLHLWRPFKEAIPLPPSILVGLPELNIPEHV